MSLEYPRIYTAFESSMRALYALNETVVKITEDEEFSLLKDFYSDLMKFFPDFIDEEEVLDILSRYIKLDKEEDILRPQEILDELGLDLPKEYVAESGDRFNMHLFIDDMKKWQEQDSESFSIFLRVIYKITRNAPIRSELLRRGILLSLVSIFDDLVEQFIEDISDTDSLKKWKTKRWKGNNYPTFVGVKELYICSLLDNSRLNDIVNFLWGNSEELFERRNVFSHSSGLVDDKYLRIAEDYAEKKSLSSGERLRLSKNYMRKSLDLVYLLGNIMIQTAWRKFDSFNDDIENADKKIITSQKLMLQDARYEVALQFSKWGDFVIKRESPVSVHKSPPENTLQLRRQRYTFLINYAMALDEMGDQREVEKQLKRIKHPEWSYAVRSAIAIIRRNEHLAIEYLGEAVKQESSVSDLFLDDSPVFQRIADNPDYAKIRNLAKKNLS